MDRTDNKRNDIFLVIVFFFSIGRFGGGGQPMDVIFPISVAPIDELGEISLKSGRYQRSRDLYLTLR